MWKYVDVFSDIKPKFEELFLETNKGNLACIKFFKLDDKNHNYIENLINTKIENFIIKKIFVNKKKLGNNLMDWDNRGNGIEGQFIREIKYLKAVYKEPHFPILLSTNLEKKEIYINYCGKKIDKNNVPSNWKTG